MSEVLERAKAKQREFANNTAVTIRLSLLEDLIAEIEQLSAGRTLKNVVGLAEARNKRSGPPEHEPEESKP